MDRPRIILSQKEASITGYHLYVESKTMLQMNLFTKQKQTHRHRKRTSGYQRERVGRDKLGVCG